MEFKVLAIGDVVGNPGMERVRRKLRQLKRKTEADFVIVNGRMPAWWALPRTRRRTFWMPGRM